MRLIDADKLIRTVRFLTLRDGKEIEIHYVKVERIDSAPTIDAVPVDWLREQEESVLNSDAFRDECAGVRLAWMADREDRRMKRFIDADVLMESLKKWRDEWDPVNNGHIAIDEVIKNVEKMPTVDAVPVEYIRLWIHELNHVRRNGNAVPAMVLQALLDAWARSERKEE